MICATSVAESGAFADVTGSFDADYPIDNLADPVEITKVSRVTPAGGAVAFTCVLSADQTVSGLALVAHTLPAGATVRARFYSDSLSTLVEDVSATAIPTPVTGYAQTYPVIMVGGSDTIRSVRIDIASAGSDPIDLGCLQVGEFWEWPWITAGMDAGFNMPADDIELEGGGAFGAQGVKKRTRSGEVSWMALATSSSDGIDFQARTALSLPFVFVEDYATPANWPRDCFLAVNSEVPAIVAAMFDRDTFQFRFSEHRR